MNLFFRKRRHAVKLPRYHIEAIASLGRNPDVTAWLKKSGIWETAQHRLKEVYYHVENENKQRKYFCAAGWQNETGHWQVSSRNFTGCLGLAAITTLPGSPAHLLVFEHYFQYLTWLKTTRQTGTIIILNHPKFLPLIHQMAKDYETVELFDTKT